MKFTLLSKYAPYLVSNPRNEMSSFRTHISNHFKEECRTTMLHHTISLFRLIVYAQSIEESILEKRGTYEKRGRIDE